MKKERQKQYERGFLDTKTFAYSNLNPAGKITSDCSTRTLAAAIGVSYGEAIDIQAEAAKRLNLGLTDADLVETILLERGFEKISIKAVKGRSRENAGQMAKRFATKYAVVVMRLAHHFTVAREGKVRDIWDCTGKTVYRAFGW